METFGEKIKQKQNSNVTSELCINYGKMHGSLVALDDMFRSCNHISQCSHLLGDSNMASDSELKPKTPSSLQ